MAFPKQVAILWRHSTKSTMNFLHNQDATLDAMIESFFTTTTEEEAKRAFLEVEQYCLRQHYDILTVCPQSYNVWSPNLMGYSGEAALLNMSNWVAKIWKK
jgi:ABC-type transport system substrate-binding protein